VRIHHVILIMHVVIILPMSALASDPFSTEDLIEHGRAEQSIKLDQTADVDHCAKEKILSPLTLTDVVDLALCNNPQTRSLWASARGQAALVGTSTAAYLPTLSAQGSVSNNQYQAGSQAQVNSFSQTASLSINYLLYDFGGRSATLENAKQLLIAANATRDATLQSNFLSAVQAYYALLSARASVQSYQVDELKAQESLAAAQARYQAGVATPVDRLQAQTTLSQAKLNRIRGEGDATNAQGALATIMGFDASQPYTLQAVTDETPDPAIEQDIGKLITVARQKRPDLAAAESQIRAAEEQLQATKATGMPTFNVGAMAGVTNPDIQSSSIGITLNVPLFSGFKTNYQVRAAEAQVEARVADRDSLANQIALDVWKAYQGLLTNSQALISADDLVLAATQSEQMILGRYKAGIGNILDTLTAQSALASARQQRVSALYNFLISRFALAQAIGLLDLTEINGRN
jgi:outer membrane protein